MTPGEQSSSVFILLAPNDSASVSSLSAHAAAGCISTCGALASTPHQERYPFPRQKDLHSSSLPLASAGRDRSDFGAMHSSEVASLRGASSSSTSILSQASSTDGEGSSSREGRSTKAFSQKLLSLPVSFSSSSERKSLSLGDSRTSAFFLSPISLDTFWKVSSLCSSKLTTAASALLL